jgi:hypothetical protein
MIPSKEWIIENLGASEVENVTYGTADPDIDFVRWVMPYIGVNKNEKTVEEFENDGDMNSDECLSTPTNHPDASKTLESDEQ